MSKRKRIFELWNCLVAAGEHLGSDLLHIHDLHASEASAVAGSHVAVLEKVRNQTLRPSEQRTELVNSAVPANVAELLVQVVGSSAGL